MNWNRVKGNFRPWAAAVVAVCLLPAGVYASIGTGSETAADVTAKSEIYPVASSGYEAKTERSEDQKHWVYAELKDFKQLVLPKLDSALRSGLVTEEEWKSVHLHTLNWERIEEPISISYWATLLKLCVGLPIDGADALLKMYVYDFDFKGHIHREDAAAGLVKLLTLNHISGSSTAEELESAKVLKDLSDVREVQLELVKKAYVLGVLDRTVKDEFRPQEILTNAEAVSMMYRLLVLFNDTKPVGSDWASTHWAVKEMAEFRQVNGKKAALADRLFKEFNLDRMGPNQPVPVKYWNDMLLRSLNLFGHVIDKETVASYTYKEADGEYIKRDKAVASLMKLWPYPQETTQEQRDTTARAFKDYKDFSEQEALVQAKHQNMVVGYDGWFHPKKHITVAEAMVLLGRLIDRL